MLCCIELKSRLQHGARPLDHVAGVLEQQFENLDVAETSRDELHDPSRTLLVEPSPSSELRGSCCL